MKGHTGSSRSRSPPSLSLEMVEPYFVAFTLISGGMALFGPTLGNIPILVVTSWLIFLFHRRPDSRAGSSLRYVPAALSACTGAFLALVPLLPPGVRLAFLAFFSTGLTWVLLPRPPGAWDSLTWTIRVGS